MTSPIEVVSRLFRADPVTATNVDEEVYPGYPGLVVADGAVRSMVWGFPLSLKGKSGQPLKPKPVNNARTDKLTSGFWRSSFEHHRCLIPMSAFAEAEGLPGSKTRTWFSVPETELFACAGLWRDSAEWGPVYSMIMTDGSPSIELIHDRMPVILTPATQAVWLNAATQEALALCVPYEDELSIDATNEPWNRRL